MSDKKKSEDIWPIIILIGVVVLYEKIKKMDFGFWYRFKYQFMENIELIIFCLFGISVIFWIMKIILFSSTKKIVKNAGSLQLGTSKTLLKGNKLNLNNIEVKSSLLEKHMLVLGSSGSGKTYSVLQPLAKFEIEQCETIFILDPKGDRSFSDFVFEACCSVDRESDYEFYSISDPGDKKLNLFFGFTQNEVKDLIIAATNWSEPYYKKVAEYELLNVLNQIPNQSLSKIVSMLPSKKELSGLLADLNLMRISDYGQMVSEEGETLHNLYQQGKVSFFSLNTQAYPEASVQMGRIILGALMNISNHVQNNIKASARKRVTIIVDEFGSFLTPTFINFLNKARSSNFRLILATQSVGDLEVYGDHLKKQIIENTPNKIVLKMADPDSIEYASKFFGTTEIIKETERVRTIWGMNQRTGEKSSRSVQEFLVHPNEIKNLKIGEGFVLTSDPMSYSRCKFKGATIKMKKSEREKILKNGKGVEIARKKSSEEGREILDKGDVMSDGEFQKI